jgi:hypothetical protein
MTRMMRDQDLRVREDERQKKNSQEETQDILNMVSLVSLARIVPEDERILMRT